MNILCIACYLIYKFLVFIFYFLFVRPSLEETGFLTFFSISNILMYVLFAVCDIPKMWPSVRYYPVNTSLYPYLPLYSM